MTVSPFASVATSGAGAHGILAQSAGGSGPSESSNTKVDVSAFFDVLVSGAGAHGIFAQSAADGMGGILVNVLPNRTVQGGGMASVAGAESGAAIFIKQGTISTTNNDGTIRSIERTSGVAIRAVDSNLTINNDGLITGKVINDGASGAPITLVNYENGVINTGRLVDVEREVNLGDIVIGGADSLRHTQLAGDLISTATSSLQIDLGDSTTSLLNDLLQVDGTVVFAIGSKIDVSILDGVNVTPNSIYDIVAADDLMFETGDLMSFLELPDVEDGAFKATLATADGMEVLRLRTTTAPVPLPMSVRMLLSACLPFLLIRICRRRGRLSVGNPVSPDTDAVQ